MTIPNGNGIVVLEANMLPRLCELPALSGTHSDLSPVMKVLVKIFQLKFGFDIFFKMSENMHGLKRLLMSSKRNEQEKNPTHTAETAQDSFSPVTS